MFYYHITNKKNLESIKREGLTPRIGKNSEDFGESVPAVYLFPEIESAFEAIINWFGECFEEEDEIVLLEISLDNIIKIEESSAKYEVLVFEKIPYENIISIKDANDEKSYIKKSRMKFN